MTQPLQLASASPANIPTPAPSKPAAESGGSFFSDLLEIINPLQHLPVISTLYRAITGDKIGSFEQIAGDTLFGGIYGAVSSFVNLAVKDLTGEGIGDHILDFAENLTGIHLSGNKPSSPTMLASLEPETGHGISPLNASALAPVHSLAALNLSAPAPLPISVTPPPATAAVRPQVAGGTALLAALSSRGISGELALRALAAYQQSLQLKS